MTRRLVWWAAALRRLLGRCDVCGARLCSVWAAGLEDSPSPAVGILHRGVS